MIGGMFDFARKRNWKQAIGFYFFFLVALLLIGFVIGAIYGVIARNEADQQGIQIVAFIFAVLISATLAILTIAKKKCFTAAGILLAILAPVSAVFGGLILGLIPVAILTTREPQ